jgi:hypothetical protein
MGGKTLKFPKRKKFVKSDGAKEEAEEKPISEEEHKKRIELLKQMGIVKDNNDTNTNNSENSSA